MANQYWTDLDQELAEKVMGWKMVSLSLPEWKEVWPAWPRETIMRLVWMVEDPEDTICSIEAAPGTGKNGHWQPGWIPSFSTKLEEAMLLFNRMRNLGHRWLLNMDLEGFHLRRVISVLRGVYGDEKQYLSDFPLGSAATLAELPMVICLAALKEIKEVK